MKKILALVIIYTIINISFAMYVSDDIAAIKDRAEANSIAFKEDVNKIIFESSKAAERVNINKKEFLELQKNLLNKQYKRQENSKETIVFVSFSMPDVAIRNLLKEASRHQASIVINGLYDNSMDATIKKMAEYINKENNNGGIEINPNLFQDHQIKAVPAFVFKNNSSFDVVYGASSISHAIDVIDKGKAV
jgi:conjugal transfer pilus assembly protein TrbC